MSFTLKDAFTGIMLICGGMLFLIGFSFMGNALSNNDVESLYIALGIMLVGGSILAIATFLNLSDNRKKPFVESSGGEE